MAGSTDRPKAVLIGGPCDGLIVRLPDGDPPARLTVLATADHPAYNPSDAAAFAVPGAVGKPAVLAAPIHYQLGAVATDGVATRVSAYYPAERSQEGTTS